MNKNQSSYRQIFKATSLFGGVQVFNIIIAIIRSKIIAILLGPAGMGLAGLFTATVGLISKITDFGLGVSAVRNVAASNKTGDEDKIALTITVLRRLVWVTGLLGLVVSIFFAPMLSRITFGNQKYTVAFIWLSVTLLFNQLTIGQNVILQGLRQLKYLARANMLGSVAGLLISIPLYYFLKIQGIVPALILTSLSSMVIAWLNTRHIKIHKITVNRKETIEEGKDMMKMGFLLSLNGLMVSGSTYIVRIFINNMGDVKQVGLYTAGMALITTYVGMVFVAMGTDYFPRLSEVAKDNKKAGELINHQAEIAILILAPLLCVFLIFINYIIVLFYSNKFLGINEMIHWAVLGVYFKAASWAISFFFVAKGDTKIFFFNELIFNIYLLFLSVLGYKYGGLEGLGISFLVGYLFYFLQVFFVAMKKYQFSFSLGFYKILFVQFLFGLICFLLVNYIDMTLAYVFGLIVILISVWYSYIQIDKRIGLKAIILNLKNRKKN